MPDVTDVATSVVLLAQDPGTDLKRDAGLRGEDFSNAVIGLCLVFSLGLAGLAVVVWKGRRRPTRPPNSK